MKKVTLTIGNDQAWITLNRPDKRNAVDFDVIQLLDEALEEVKERSDVKIVLITGAGNEAFCSGGDLSIFHEIHTKEEAKKMLRNMASVLFKLFFFPKPTVAYLNGTAVGGGCEIATACDFRVAKHEEIKLGFIQGRLGITTGWGGSTYLFERISSEKAFQLLMSATIFTAKEGMSNQFIQHVLNVDELNSWISYFTKQPIGVLQAYKQRRMAKYDRSLIESLVEKELNECATLWETPEHHAAVQQFINK